jgi:transposase-like protein
MENENERTGRPRRRFSAEEKTRVVEQYRESGLTRAEFCRHEGASLFNLQRWLRKQNRCGEARFVEVEESRLGAVGEIILLQVKSAWKQTFEDDSIPS